MDNVEKVSNTDKRPAIAFDNAGEVELIQIALRSYKSSASYNATTVAGTDSLINRLESLLDELDKVRQMFNNKE